MKILVYCMYCDEPLEFESEYIEEMDWLEIATESCDCDDRHITLH